MAASELFKRISENSDENVRFEISVTMVEIYLDKI